MERCFGHFYAPLRCHSRSRWVHKWVVLGVKNSQNYRMPVSRLGFWLNMASCHFGYFWAINHPFSGPPSHRCMAQWPKNGLKPWPHMGQGCSGWKGSQSEHNCVTDSKKSEKTCQKWPKIAQTMAIFRHKWLLYGVKRLFSSMSSC